MTDYASWFFRITEKQPFPYQQRLATTDELPILLDVPTGAGKTAAVVLAWLWRRRFHSDQKIRDSTPRRLVYCLPMRTLVEQTYTEVENWLNRSDLAADVELHLLMGGALSQRWDAHPEKDSILVGTNDQLLSRALNRGYGMSRYRWPIHFALLNNDCLWVMDEVQLMGIGFLTTAQLQGFRLEFGTMRPTYSLWMSATLDRELLQTVNYQPDLSKIHELTEFDKVHPILQQRLEAKKRLVKTSTVLTNNELGYGRALAMEIKTVHSPGSLTLVLCNRVSRAQMVYQELQKLVNLELLLIHARFRPYERQELNKRLRKTHSGIIVATQAVEAGVDISAFTLFTELAPWSSLVQRIGRCNRYGEYSEATVYWVDIDQIHKNSANPYELEDLSLARVLLSPLTDVGPQSLQKISPQTKYPEGLLPRRHDLLQLFDTSSDLAGNDIDISPFIRETEDTDVAIAWRNWDGDKPPSDPKDKHYRGALQQNELCCVSIFRAKELLDQLRKQKKCAWVWDSLQGEWVEARAIYPGTSLLLHDLDGGYSTTLGFTGDRNHQPLPVETPVIELERDDADPLTYQVGKYVTLADHSQDVVLEVRQLCLNLCGYNLPVELLERAGRWHDLGKAHPVFQARITRGRTELVESGPWAKSEQKSIFYQQRRGFRHELVSALVAMQVGEDFILTYLIAAHHGKVRLTIQPRPTENKPPEPEKKYALGVWEGDEVPAVNLGDGLVIPPQTLSLDCMALGDGDYGESWSARAVALLSEVGPFKLAFLESVIRIADWRASAKYAPNILGLTDA